MTSEWGYSSLASNQSDSDRTDLRLIQAIGNVDLSIFWCIGCGSCAATCTSGQYNNFNPRKTFHSIKSGHLKEIEIEIAKCVLCEKCQFVCPRHVNTRNILFHLKRIIGQNAL